MNFREWFLLEKLGKQYSYSCVLAAFKQNDAIPIIRWSKDNISDSVLCVDGDGKGRENEIHVTVLYGLHTNSVSDVEKIIKDVQPFQITLGKISKFDTNPNYDVIKISVTGPKLHALNTSLRSLDHTSNYDKYVPHCTVAYVKKGRCDNLMGNQDFEGKKVQIDSITFSPAEGEKRKIRLVSL